ncbi:hypothetical protein AX14_002779 [Amanita brunnescens Koide BX004]|nr:hypothetical protein AX14_002779 [Amanita brunnescens Koide BX004]
MRYLFQNTHKSRKTVHDLLDLRRNAIDILFIQEAPVNFVRKVPSATDPEGEDLIGPVIHKSWICVDRHLAFPNSAVSIYVNKHLTASYQLFPVEKPQIHRDILFLRLKHNFLKGHDFTVCNVYNRPGARNAAVTSFLQTLPSFTDLAVVEGDFNLHSPLWDSAVSKGSPMALSLYENLSKASLNLMNDEYQPTWTNRRGSESVIDLLFVNDRLLSCEPFVEVALDSRGRSDHAILSCLFGSQLARPGKPYIAKDSEEEDEFCFFLGSALASVPGLMTTLNVEDTCHKLSALIVEKWDSLAKTLITSRPHGTSWWNDQCQAYRDAYDLNRSKENLKAYNAVTRKARSAFFEEKITIMTAIKKPWEGVRWTRPRPPPPYSTIEVDSQAPKDVDELFMIMHSQFSQAAARSPSEEDIKSLLEPLHPLPERSFPEFSCQEVRDAIALTGNGNGLAPGPDRITWELLKMAFQVNNAPEGLCHLFNQIRASGVWPSWFKQSTCIIIPKPNKPRYNVPKAFRPISLLNTLGKLLTKITAARMQFDCLKYDILHPGQCSGVVKHVTIDAGVTLASFVAESRELGLHSMASDFTFDIGTPQGDCISPILSAIYLAAGLKISTPLTFPPPNVRSLFFVDDGLLYCASRKPSQNVRRIEGCLDKIQNTLAVLGLFIDVDKTELIHFPGFVMDKPGRKLAPPSTLPIRMRDLQQNNIMTTIKSKGLIRYLGFFFDSELNWNAHVTFYFNRAFSTIRALRMLGSSIRGLGTLQKRHAYQACALPVLTYGLPLWFAENGAGVKSRLSKINKVHSHACKWITGCFRTTPIGAREVIAGLPPLVTLLNAQLHGFSHASISRKTRPTHLPSDVPFRRLRTHLVQEQFEHAVDPQRPGQRVLDLFGNRVTIDTSSPKKGTAPFKAWVRDLKTEIEQVHDKPESVTIYTDGAFHHSNYKVAFAFTIPQGNTWHDHYNWCPAASSFDAELRAIESALEYVIGRVHRDHILIFIDNKAAANSLFNFDVKSCHMSVIRINLLLSAWLSENHQRTLTIRFIPSHQGITGNERADQLTKAGLEQCPTNPPPHPTVPIPIRTQTPRRARMAKALEGCHIQGVPVCNNSKVVM